MGDAGALVTSDSKLADWCALYARHGGKGEHLIEGINSRMDGLQAAILNAKMPSLEAWTARRRTIAKRYDELLRGVGDIAVPVVSPDAEHVYHLYVIKTGNREAIQKKFKENGVGFSVNYPRALPFYPAYAALGHKHNDFPNAYRNQSMILSIPIFPEMTDGQQDRVVELLRGCF